MTKKYWHELTDEEFENIPPKIKCTKLRKLYSQPDWCSYPDAIDSLGCWSLIDKDLRKKISIDYCKCCDLFNNCPTPRN